MHTDRAGRVDTLPISIHHKLEMMVLFPIFLPPSPSFSSQTLDSCDVLALHSFSNLSSSEFVLLLYPRLSILYIRHMPSIYPYYILDMCIDIPSIFIPSTYPILNTSHTLTHPVKDAQNDKEKKM